MRLQTRLSVQVVMILLAGFIAFQLLIVIATTLPSRGSEQRPYGLPLPKEVAAMIAALERTPNAERPALIHAFDQGLYGVSLASGGVRPSPHDSTEDLVRLGDYYAATLPGHAVAVDAKRPILGALLGSRPRPARFFAPVRIAISLDDGSALVLTSQPSSAIRAYLRRRSVLGAIGGLVLLAILLVAMRQTMRPVVQLASGVRRFGSSLETSDLRVEGTREVRDLALAFNDMKRRIIDLMAERTRTLAAIAHDMRTYLTRLRLRVDYIDDADHRERAVRDLDEMATLLDDTLLLARDDIGESGEVPEVDLKAIVDDAIQMRGDEPGRIIVELPSEPVRARARPLAVRRILDNLIENGLRHGTQVHVSLTSLDGWATLTIADNGPGVAPDHLARLGEPFHRTDPSRNRESGGAGLGLAIVQALTSRDGAEVSFRNGPTDGLLVTIRYSLVLASR